MNYLQTHIKDYLDHCRYQKRLNEKTLKAYRIDLAQFHSYHGDLYTCRHVQAAGYSDEEASEAEFSYIGISKYACTFALRMV